MENDGNLLSNSTLKKYIVRANGHHGRVEKTPAPKALAKELEYLRLENSHLLEEVNRLKNRLGESQESVQQLRTEKNELILAANRPWWKQIFK